MDIQEALYEALSRRRQDLHVEQKVQEGSLPRNGKNPATESDHELELQRTRQLEVLERCLSAVPEMAPVVNKGGRPLMSSPASPPPPPEVRAQVPQRPSTIIRGTTPTFFTADDDEPYMNPFTGLMVYPVTRNSAGPSGTQSRRHYPGDETQPTILSHENRVTSNSTILQQSNVTSSSIPTVGAQTVVANEGGSQAVARDSSSVYRQAMMVARPEKLLTSTPTLATRSSFISTDSTDHLPSYDASKPPKGSKWGLFGLRGGRLQKSEVDDIMLDEGPPPLTPKLTLSRAPPKRASLSVRRDQPKARTKPKELFSPGSGQSPGIVRTVQVIPDATLFRQPSHRSPVELESPRQLPNINVPVRQPPILSAQPSRAPNSTGTSTNQILRAMYGSHWGGVDSRRAPPVEAASPPPRYSQIPVPGSVPTPQTFLTNGSAPPPYQSSPPDLPPELGQNMAQAELDGNNVRGLARQGSAARFTQRDGVAELPGTTNVAMPALSQFEADRALALQLAESDGSGSLESPGKVIPGLDLAQFLGEDEVGLDSSGFFEQQKALLAAYALQAHEPEPSGSRSEGMENARRMQRQFDNEYAQQVKQEEYAKQLQHLQDEHAREIEAQAEYAQRVQDEWAEAEKRNIEAAEKLRRAEQQRLAEERRHLDELRSQERARLEAEKRKKEAARRKAEEEERERERKAEEERLRKERMEECMACGDEHEKDSATLAYSACQHPYCLECLELAFRSAIKDRKPFSCCRQRVDIGLAARHLDAAFIKSYQLLELELDTPHPLYCSQPRCSKFIVPSAIQAGVGRCSTCGASTCQYCRRSSHTGVCAKDEDGLKFKALGKARGWKECPGCGAMVDKIDGCLHMVCDCGTEFCYSCGDRYNKCNQTCSRA